MIDPITMMAIGAGAKAIPAIVNYGENIGLRRQLRNLQNQPMPEYSVDPRINKLYEMGLADASNPEGYGGAAIGNFRRMLSRGMRGRFGNAVSMGGGARGINAVLAGQEGDALGNFYAGDEAIRRANRQTGMGRMGTAASVSQAVRDRNAQQKLNYRLMLEQALGGSIRSNKDYINNMIGGLGSDLITAGAYLDGGGIGEEEQVLGGGKVGSELPPSINDLRTYGKYEYRNNPTIRRLMHPEDYRPSGFGQGPMTKPLIENYRRRRF